MHSCSLNRIRYNCSWAHASRRRHYGDYLPHYEIQSSDFQALQTHHRLKETPRYLARAEDQSEWCRWIKSRLIPLIFVPFFFFTVSSLKQGHYVPDWLTSINIIMHETLDFLTIIDDRIKRGHITDHRKLHSLSIRDKNTRKVNRYPYAKAIDFR